MPHVGVIGMKHISLIFVFSIVTSMECQCMTTDTVEETALRPVASAMRVFTHQHGRQPKTWEEIGS
jgi:hypothetical protein